jgi:hypothetical protein
MLRGQIWLYSADPTVGDEIGKTRPVVIVSNNEMGTLRLKANIIFHLEFEFCFNVSKLSINLATLTFTHSDLTSLSNR